MAPKAGSVQDRMKMVTRIQSLAFRFRSYTPVPFLLLAVTFAKPTVIGITTGLVLIGGGEFLRLCSVAAAGVKTRSTSELAAVALVTTGPFAWSRNPIYTGNLIIYFGVGLMSMGLFPWLLIGGMAWFLLQYSLIIAYEEKYLATRFGSEYEAYRAEVNRFIPTLQSSRIARGSVSVLEGFPSERRTFQAELLVVGVLIGMYLFGVMQG